MVKLYEGGVWLLDGEKILSVSEIKEPVRDQSTGREISPEEGAKGTMAYHILEAHNSGSDMDNLSMRFDSLTSHDITYVGIIQTARASGMKEFPMPYVLTNCHNSLCAVGGTINEDDHMFALSAAHKFGGIYVPTNMAVIHSVNRELMAGCGKMILGSDSHTRYGALGTLAVGEGGGELAKQLVGRTYDIARPGVVAIYLSGKPKEGVGPQDVALSIIGAVYQNGYVKNKVMEFVGPGVGNLPMEYRNGIDVMTTETTCWSSIWITDEKTEEYLDIHGRKGDYKQLSPAPLTYYDGCVYVDLDTVECMIALPMHPSNTLSIRELLENPADILHECQEKANKQITGASLQLDSKVRSGNVYVEQGIVAGCSGGTFDNICAVADILRGQSVGNGEFTMSVYPGSMPAYRCLMKNGALYDIVGAGAIVRECFCGPCFGAGDTPANGEFSIRHATRNFPNREGSKPGEGQMVGVALMDARSIAATAIHGGKLTPATDLDVKYTNPPYYFDGSVYDKRLYNGFGKAEPSYELKMGPNIKDWPSLPELSEDLLLKIVSYITDPVTTTDELIPSGETSSYRSNPLRLAEFTLSRKDPDYVARAKEVQKEELIREAALAVRESGAGEEAAEGEKRAKAAKGADGVNGVKAELSEEIRKVYEILCQDEGIKKAGIKPDPEHTVIGSTIYANKPGDGSAREQAASCQRVLGAVANIATDYATKRYRSNCVNWGMIPFKTSEPDNFELFDYVFLPGVRKGLSQGSEQFDAYIVKKDGSVKKTLLETGQLTDPERQILLDGCLINYYRGK